MYYSLKLFTLRHDHEQCFEYLDQSHRSSSNTVITVMTICIILIIQTSDSPNYLLNHDITT